MAPEEFWITTPREFTALLNAHYTYEKLTHGQGPKEEEYTTIDQIPGW